MVLEAMVAAFAEEHAVEASPDDPAELAAEEEESTGLGEEVAGLEQRVRRMSLAGEFAANELKALTTRLERLRRRVVREGEVLTANTCGDMIVEYLSANQAMLLFFFFGPVSAFRLDAGAALTLTLVAQALAAQHVPELVGDFIATWFEVRAGLPVLEYFQGQLAWRTLAPKIAFTACVMFLLLLTMRTYEL